MTYFSPSDVLNSGMNFVYVTEPFKMFEDESVKEVLLNAISCLLSRFHPSSCILIIVVHLSIFYQ